MVHYLAIILLCFTTLIYSTDPTPPTNFKLKITVVDSETKEPLAGVKFGESYTNFDGIVYISPDTFNISYISYLTTAVYPIADSTIQLVPRN